MISKFRNVAPQAPQFRQTSTRRNDVICVRVSDSLMTITAHKAGRRLSTALRTVGNPAYSRAGRGLSCMFIHLRAWVNIRICMPADRGERQWVRHETAQTA